MSELDSLGREYIESLRAYLMAGDESALSHAYELGRRAMIDGLGVLDMAILQRAAVDALVVTAPAADQPRLARGAAELFAELLSPFEMSFRGYRAANDELQRLNESLRRQKEAVESVNQELESFSYSVSHDLRAPLRRIDGFSQILIEDFAAALDDGGRDYLRRIRESTAQMAKLIEDLLALAKVARTAIRIIDVDLSALAHSIVDELAAGSPGRAVAVHIAPGVHAEGDVRLLVLVLENLLGNAWKFTVNQPAARIEFGLVIEQRDGKPVYFVRDNGAGFDMADADKLFAPFQRLDSAAEFEGSGVGLATVQRIIHRHDGRIWADSTLGAGATFYFTLGRRR